MPTRTPVREPVSVARPSPALVVGTEQTRRTSIASILVRALLLTLLGVAVLGEVALLLVALVPQTIWAAHGYPAGPIPLRLAPVVAGLFYVLPSVIGALCRRWQVAVVLATLPAWVDLGAFAIAASVGGHIGPFYLVQDPHSVSTVGTLELFAALGALGWMARSALLGAMRRGERTQR